MPLPRPIRATLLPAALLLAAVLAPALGLMRGGSFASPACGSDCRADCGGGVLATDENTGWSRREAADEPPEAAAPKTPTATPSAPELTPNLGWLNTDIPLRLSDELKGHVVVLDFWTYCCINCMHILPDLAALEEKYKDQPVLIVGVHSAKFENESDRTAIRAAVQRYAIHHPVVVDKNYGIWRRYGAQGWPSFAVIGSDGKLRTLKDAAGEDATIISGEGHKQRLDGAIAAALAAGKASGTLAAKPFKPKLDANVPAPSGLAFPGKVLAVGPSETGGNKVAGGLFIADSSNNRIVQATLPDAAGKSTLIAVFGTREPELANGDAKAARFRGPQGMAFDAATSTLYVADTNNHAIRAINLKTGTTETTLGDGTQGHDRTGGKAGDKQPISSPWDVALNAEGSVLYIAMAGTHQLWSVDLASRVAAPIAGSGAEDLVDATAKVARLAQPSGLALSADGSKLYFADSEVSAIRSLSFKSNQVRTTIGVGLFEFGDIDGTFPEARLQHPLGVAVWPREPGSTERMDRLLVADTYNHKIKLVDVAKESSTSWIGVGRGTKETPRSALVLDEPGGLCLLRESGPPVNDWLFIADTNNHRIIRVNAATKAWVEVQIKGLAALDAPASPPEKTK